MDALLFESIDRFVAGCSTPTVVREVERGQGAAALWAEVESSGYAELLVDEAAGGAGLGLREAFALWLACGRHALPVPLGHTAWVRAVLPLAGVDAPKGPLTLAAQCSRDAKGEWSCQNVPFGMLADWVLVGDVQGAALLPVASGERRPNGVYGSLQAHIQWPADPAGALPLPGPIDLLHAGALMTATLMAGAMLRVLEATLTYANDRAQFGKSIGKFQAVQQQLSVMVEQVFAARMAAEIGCTGDGIAPHPLRAAVAKARASEAAEKVVAIAHAVHGAIGVTAEYDLQLHTRRLQEWRADFGSQAYWHAQLGAALLAAPQASTLQFLLAELVPSKHV
jgi:alkylation response protein AidB-like acyl-CoA dehydrogenase